MSALLETPEFRAELPGWVLRGVLCAANSAWWAVMAGFTHPAEIAGMVLGVAVWVVAFTAFGGWARQTGRIAPARFADAVKTAAWIKLLLVVVGLPAMFCSRFLPEWMTVFVFGFSMDMVLGMLALSGAAWLAGMTEFDQIARMDSLGWTTLTTVLEGALMASLILLIAAAVLGWRWSKTAGQFSRVRNPDQEVVQPPGPGCS